MWFSRVVKTAVLVCIGCFLPWTIQALNSTDGKITLDIRQLVTLASQLGIETRNERQQVPVVP